VLNFAQNVLHCSASSPPLQPRSTGGGQPWSRSSVAQVTPIVRSRLGASKSMVEASPNGS
jgi:hypothetical protein